MAVKAYVPKRKVLITFREVKFNFINFKLQHKVGVICLSIPKF